MRLHTILGLTIVAGSLVLAGCMGSPLSRTPGSQRLPAGSQPESQPAPDLNPANNVYAYTGSARVKPALADVPPRVYVPDSQADMVDVIDPLTFRILDHFAVGRQPHHITPSWDLQVLYVNNTYGNSLTPIDPRSAEPLTAIPVPDPYNLYFTPDGTKAIVVAERRRRLDFRDPHSWKLIKSVPIPWPGVDHLDFSADGRYLIASCEFGARMIKVDVAAQRYLGTVHLRPGGMPQDVKLSPDGKVFYVADMHANGVYMIDGEGPSVIGFIPTGRGTHGLYASRDSKVLYASNRGEGTVSLIDFATRAVVKKWTLPGGGSPDMGGVSEDGKVLWLSGRYHSEVYAIDTRDGKLLARIKVGREPHGLCVYPQPGRYSLGHTGVFR